MLLVFCFSLSFLVIITPVRAYDYTGSLLYQDDMDWYSVELTSGQLLSLTLPVPSGSDFDLWVATTTCLQENEYNRHVPINDAVDYSLAFGDTTENINYNADSTTTYYIGVHSHSGSDSYTLTSNVVLTEDPELSCFDPTMIIMIVVGVVVVMIIVIAVVVSAKKRSTGGGYAKRAGGGYSASKSPYASTYRPASTPSYTPSTPSAPSYTPARSSTSGMFDDLGSTPSTSAPYEVPKDEPVSGKKKACPKCGVEWGAEAIFCGDCGHKFT